MYHYYQEFSNYQESTIKERSSNEALPCINQMYSESNVTSSVTNQIEHLEPPLALRQQKSFCQIVINNDHVVHRKSCYFTMQGKASFDTLSLLIWTLVITVGSHTLSQSLPQGSTLEVEFTSTMFSANVKLKWPKTFTMTVTMLNQTGDHDHHQITKDLEVTTADLNDEIQIDNATIDNAPPGVQYIVNGHVKFQILIL